MSEPLNDEKNEVIPETVTELEIPEDFVDISEPNSPGLYKKVIRQGSGESPVSGERVIVHYVGTLYGGEKNGEKFDSSRDRGTNFDFTLGDGHVIRGWDVGVATMKKSEICELICRPNYGYGDKAQGSIPRNSTLKFEIELLDYKSEDLTYNKDGGVLRRILEKGDGYNTPADGSHVEVELTGYKTGDDESKAFDRRTVKFDIGDSMAQTVVHGVETAVKHMKVNERSEIYIRSDYGFGTAGKPEWGVPGDMDLYYLVKLLSFEKLKESYELHSTADRLSQSTLMKSKGTEYFKRGNIRMALVYYERIVSYLENEETENENDKKAKNDLLVAARLNCALCHLKESELSECIKQCEKILNLQPDNEKAAFRMAEAYYQRNDIDSALSFYKKTLEINPNNGSARIGLKYCISKQKELLNAEKKMCRDMFSKMFSEGEKTESQPVGSAHGE